MLKRAIPVLHVSSSRATEAFYCGKLGFTLEFAMRPFDGDDPCYMGFRSEDAYLHASSFPGDGVSGGVVMIETEDLDRLFQRMRDQGVAFNPEPVDQTWGNREMYTRDPDRNSVRFFQPIR